VQDEAKLDYDSDIDGLSNDVEEPEVGAEKTQDESNKDDYYNLTDILMDDGATGTYSIRRDGILLDDGATQPTPPKYWFIWGAISQG